MEIIAHRGGQEYKPANTIEAISYCLDYTSRVEIDVRKCGSGEIVVNHDPIIRGSRVYEIGNTNLDKIKTLTESSVPTLDEVLEFIHRDTTLHIELKEIGIVEDVLRVCDDYECEIIFSSFLEDSLLDIDEYETAYLFLTGWEYNIRKAIEVGCSSIHPVNYLITKDRVLDAKKRGLGVRGWTVNNIVEAKRMKDIGVDAIISDSIKSL